MADNTGKAQDKLRHIGEVLAEKRSRQPRMAKTQIVGKRWEVEKKIKAAGISKLKDEGKESQSLKNSLVMSR